MKKHYLLFAIKCSVIIYFSACTGINKLGDSKSITRQVTHGKWKVNCFSNSKTDITCNFEGYTFNFEESGRVIAVNNENRIEGNWLEDQITKKITIRFDDSNEVLNDLNNYWNITSVTNEGISFEKISEKDTEKMYLSKL